LFFFFPLMVLDDEGIGKAYARSSRLVQGNWLRTANMLMFMLLAYIAALLIFGNVFALLSGADESAFQEGNFIVEMTYVVTSTMTTPLFFSIMLVQFHDLKLRKEGRSSQKKTPPSQKDFIA
ncbi:MAG: hypothetical protein GY862_04390, partial [Gammaproteobacteria bacterium]|nr:hypothetical protein [Gammaproteobacteria bacterium]